MKRDISAAQEFHISPLRMWRWHFSHTERAGGGPGKGPQGKHREEARALAVAESEEVGEHLEWKGVGRRSLLESCEFTLEPPVVVAHFGLLSSWLSIWH